MADELLWETLVANIADGTTASNSAAEFRNDSSRKMHIRTMMYLHQYSNAENNEDGSVEISKSPVLAFTVNNGVFFTWAQFISAEASTTGAATDDTSHSINGGRNFGVGQLTLEPNESLFLNGLKVTGGVLDFSYEIGFHF